MPGKHVLAVLGHPDAESFNHAIMQRYISSLPRDCEVRTLMLGELDFDPVLRFGYRQRMAPDPVIARSQELLLWADHVVLVFPCWWTGVPSLLKGWFDRVLTPGFAYNEDNSGLLSLGMRHQEASCRTHRDPHSHIPRSLMVFHAQWLLSGSGGETSDSWFVRHPHHANLAAQLGR
jgi:putative NADPH-quinone reductase